MARKLKRMELTIDEQHVIEALKQVAEHWPESLSLVGYDVDEPNEFMVMKDDPREPGISREVARISGIRNGDA